MNTSFGIDSGTLNKNDMTIGFSEITFSRPSSPELAFSSPDADSFSPEPASLDDNQSIVIPFPEPASLDAASFSPEPASLDAASPEPASLDAASPEPASLDAASPEPASLDDNQSIVIPFPDDDNVSAPQPQPAQLQPAQPQPRTIPVEEWTHLIHDSPEECIRCCKAEESKLYVRRSYRPRTASNWLFLYRIQLVQGRYVNMEDVLSSMLEYAWNVARAKKVWGRYSYQDPEHVRLWVWVNYRTPARIYLHHLHGDLPCGARYDYVSYARMRLEAQQGKPIFERLMRGGEHDEGITFFMFA